MDRVTGPGVPVERDTVRRPKTNAAIRSGLEIVDTPVRDMTPYPEVEQDGIRTHTTPIPRWTP